ncbi:hypothetical protein B0H22_1233 [Methanohalophilus euhalobius]|uniref:Uncharacterized protein n=2 Tax=Methanohalophilus euhalobius TaxID=51203 RepID=A0A314ZYF1_9EURY|nr:hypothetical protein B0H22_1233 [Methanohalophilus euhalobius]RNI10034.1 hypothetical protein EDD83_04390 [Methanohalophilus euhalobius]
MYSLWYPETEKDFFEKSLELTTKEQLFYKTEDNRYLAYWPKKYSGKKSTLQSRNAFIGNYTEKMVVNLLQNFAKSNNLFVLQGVICEELGLTSRSPADVAFCKTNNTVQKAENIKLIIEVKMSVVWNWEYINGELILVGDYSSHQGTPGLLRSDSMLKAIGKAINIRVSGNASSDIPIVILGNTPIQKSYIKKVDHLKKAGIVQGFWSLNPKPKENETLEMTPKKGFIRMNAYEDFVSYLNELISHDFFFFSSMKSKKELGQIIEICNQEDDFEEKGHKFLELIGD